MMDKRYMFAKMPEEEMVKMDIAALKKYSLAHWTEVQRADKMIQYKEL
jgi:hypothetical protein